MNFGDGPKGNKFAHAGIGENNVDSWLYGSGRTLHILLRFAPALWQS